jgi:hypothetical protein
MTAFELGVAAGNAVNKTVKYGIVVGLVAVAVVACSGKEDTKASTPAVNASTAPVVKSNWETVNYTDKMSGKSYQYKQTTSLNTESLRFPYNGGSYVNVILYDNGNVGFYINKGQLRCQSYSSCYIAVKFDNNEVEYVSAYGPDDGSSNIAFVRYEAGEKLQAKIAKATTMKIELPLYQAAGHIFEFNVSK